MRRASEGLGTALGDVGVRSAKSTDVGNRDASIKRGCWTGLIYRVICADRIFSRCIGLLFIFGIGQQILTVSTITDRLSLRLYAYLHGMNLNGLEFSEVPKRRPLTRGEEKRPRSRLRKTHRRGDLERDHRVRAFFSRAFVARRFHAAHPFAAFPAETSLRGRARFGGPAAMNGRDFCIKDARGAGQGPGAGLRRVRERQFRN